MRHGVTVLVVVVVAAIALAAGIDALRGEQDPAPAAETVSTSTTSEGPTNYVPLEDEPGGTLYFTDASCELQAIELPRQRAAEAPGWDECRFVLSPSGQRASGVGSGWDPRSDPLIGRLFQSEDGMIQVATNLGPEGEPFRGTASAWRPDGTLTYFADGAVREWPSGDVVLSQRELLRAIRADGVPFRSRPLAVSVREAAWLDDRRLAVIMSTRIRREFGAGQAILAIYEGDRLATWRLYERSDVSDLRVSPRGSFVAARYGRDRFEMLDASGRSIDTFGIVGYRAIAWSPDDQWAAVAADGGLFIFRPGASGRPELELDIDAHDLAWRGESGPPALADADEAREWLGETGATGRLFVTQTEGSGCAIRALQLPGLEWEERPQRLPSPCRFTLDESGVALPEDVVPQPGGPETATCRGAEGCSVAWMPDGRPTFVGRGELFAGKPRDGRNEVLMTSEQLRDLLGRPSTLEEVAWVDDRRFWAVVRSGESAIVALMTTDRLVSTPSFTTRTIEGLRVSASGMVAARTDQGLVFFDTGGRRALTFRNGQAVSWAPGEQIAAVATRSEILFVAPLSGEIVTLPLAVRNLEWVVP